MSSKLVVGIRDHEEIVIIQQEWSEGGEMPRFILHHVKSIQNSDGILVFFPWSWVIFHIS